MGPRRPLRPPPDAYSPLEDYGAIGDGRTAALINRRGSVDWLCLPRFDSTSVFAALLDVQRGGRWGLHPARAAASRSEYLSGTNVLVTTYTDRAPIARVTDFMPPDAPRPTLFRKVEALNGTLTFESEFAPRPDYGRRPPNLQASPTGVSGEGMTLAISAPVLGLRLSPELAHHQIEVSPNRPAWLALAPGEQTPAELSGEDLLDQTVAFWRRKIDHLTYAGPYQADVTRSALALHLLIHAPSGAPLAAATTSLPQWIGGEGNWDYRYSWARDSSYMLAALVHLGSLEETHRYLRWLTQVCPNGEPVPVMFDLDGRRVIPEFSVDHLEGYRGSRPVRVGNLASTQLQLDIFGAVVDLAWDYDRHGGEIEAETWRMLADQVDWVLAHWREPDSGIWEPRIAPEHHVYSKIMAWVALARGAELAVKRKEASADRWREGALEVRADIEARGWNAALGAYSMFYGGNSLDAALIRIAALGYSSAREPRTQETLSAIRRTLVDGPNVFRHHRSGPDKARDAGFVLLGFWLVQALALAGDREEAESLFEELRQKQSPVGLYSEMLDRGTGRLVGNFPQGFSHLGLIESALALDNPTGRPAPHGA